MKLGGILPAESQFHFSELKNFFEKTWEVESQRGPGLQLRRVFSSLPKLVPFCKEKQIMPPSNDLRAKWIVFTILLGLVAFGGWLPLSFFIVAAFITAFLFAIKRTGQ